MFRRIHKHLVAMRYAINISAVLLVITTFGLAKGKISHAILIGIVQFFILGATMVQNDLADAEVDFLNGRRSFAHDEPEHFNHFRLFLWAASLLGSVALSLVDWRYTALALLLCFNGYIYSSTRRIVGLPAFIVAFTIALSACFPLLHGWNSKVVLLAIAAFLGLATREISGKDVEDVAGDSRTVWKRTVAVVYGSHVAAVAGCIMLAISVMVLLCLPLNELPAAAAWSGVFFLALVSFAAFTFGSTTASKAKLIFDLGMAVFVLTCALCYLAGETGKVGVAGAPFVRMELLSLLVLFAGAWAVRIWDGKESMQVAISASPFGKYGTWAVMTALMVGVIFAARWMVCHSDYPFLYQNLIGVALIDTRSNSAPLLAASGLVGLCLMLGLNMPWYWPSGQQIIATMAAGLAFGTFAVVMDVAGLPSVITMIAIPLAALSAGARSNLTLVTKNRAFHLGIYLSVGILLGPLYAILSFMGAYIIIVPLYYARAFQQRIPILPFIDPWWRHYTKSG